MPRVATKRARDTWYGARSKSPKPLTLASWWRDRLAGEERDLFDAERVDGVERYFIDLPAGRTLYASVYVRSMQYGGPEEGGWWYECGEPVQSVMISPLDFEEWLESADPAEMEHMRHGATQAYTEGRSPKPRQTGYGGYTFAPGTDEPLTYHRTDDYRSCFEECFAKAFPEERPYYC